jgi:broad specificity phosphatase PhoE
LEVYFVRHGETVSNATGIYNAAGIDTLTPKAIAQANAVASRLASVHFDAAIVSPSPRAERTALPTLKELGTVARVWPEFEECCTQKGAARSKPASRTLPTGGKVKVLPEFKGFVTTDPAHDIMFAPANYADGEVQTRLAYDNFLKSFGSARPTQGAVFRVLIVGHSAQGSRFLDLLLGRKPIGDIQLENASITVLSRVPGGHFKQISHWANSGTKGSM